MIGDFNQERDSSVVFSLSNPASQFLQTTPPGIETPNRPFARRWELLFDKFTEIEFPSPSHYAAGSCKLTRINRIFSLIPRSSLPMLKHKSDIIRDPMWYDSNSISDHSPIFWSISLPKPNGQSVFKVKPQWANHPVYQKRLNDLCVCVDWDRKSFNDHSVILKKYMREAAFYTRDILLEEDPHSVGNKMMKLSSIARCVWFGDDRLFNRLLGMNHTNPSSPISELATKHLIWENERPAIRDVAVFEDEFRVAKLEHLEHERALINAEFKATNGSAAFGVLSKKKSKLRAVDRISKLWTKKAARMIVVGARVNSEELREIGFCEEQTEGTDSQGNYLLKGDGYFTAVRHTWKKIFGSVHANPAEHDLDILNQYAAYKTWNWNGMLNPHVELIDDYLFSLKHTGLGKDGVHNYCWKYGGEHAKHFIIRLLDAHTTRGERPDDVNEILKIFPPKGVAEDDFLVDTKGVFRHPSELRPLGLKNAENKIVAGICNWCIKPVLTECAEVSQNGFSGGRQLTQNVSDLDFEGRRAAFNFQKAYGGYKFDSDIQVGHSGTIGKIPLLLLLDFAAAFASVAHAWMFLVLQAIGFPKGWLNVVECLYDGCEAYGESLEGFVWLFSIISGILQGCPLSGSLFVFIIDPLLFLLRTHIENTGLGHVRACADDVGICINELCSLIPVQVIFENYRQLTGLTLKPAKSIIVLLAHLVSTHNKDCVHNWLTDNIPSWAGMDIVSHAKYLGFLLGPTSGRLQWKVAVKKFKERVAEINSMRLPLPLARGQYSSRAVPVLGYIAQLVRPPKDVKTLSMDACMKILRFPGKSLDFDSAHPMDMLEGPEVTQIEAYMDACMARASHKTIHSYESQLFSLRSLSLLRLMCYHALTHFIIQEGLLSLMAGIALRFVRNFIMLANGIPLIALIKTSLRGECRPRFISWLVMLSTPGPTSFPDVSRCCTPMTRRTTLPPLPPLLPPPPRLTPLTAPLKAFWGPWLATFGCLFLVAVIRCLGTITATPKSPPLLFLILFLRRSIIEKATRLSPLLCWMSSGRL